MVRFIDAAGFNIPINYKTVLCQTFGGQKISIKMIYMKSSKPKICYKMTPVEIKLPYKVKQSYIQNDVSEQPHICQNDQNNKVLLAR